MKNNIFSKRIPTIFGLLILVGGLIAGILLVSQRQGLTTQAGPTAQPKNVRIANVGSGGYTVSWTSDVPVTGFLKYSDNPTRLTLPAGDTRDQISGTTNQYTTHYVDVTGLSADKTYYFEIGSGSQTYNDGGRPYQVRTTAQAAAPPEDVISGKIVTAAGTGAGGAMVYAEITGAQTLSTLTNTDGSWRIALSNARNAGGNFVAYDQATETITNFVQAGTSGTATAITNTATDNPVPEITLGKTHNFATGEVAPIISDLSGGEPTDGFATLSDLSQAPEATYSVKLLNPSTEGESLATQTPEFLGTGPVGTAIKLILDTSGQSTTATVAASGAWSWSPPIKLSLGSHTIKLQFKENNIDSEFSRGFVIVAAGTGGLPAFTATPSATPTATATGTPTPTATSGGLPVVGILTPTYALFIVGIGLFVAGVVWKRKILADIDS